MLSKIEETDEKEPSADAKKAARPARYSDAVERARPTADSGHMVDQTQDGKAEQQHNAHCHSAGEDATDCEEELHCEVCDQKFTAPHHLKRHMGSAKHRKNASSNASAASSKAGSRREKPVARRISAASITTDESWLPEEESDVSGIADDSALSEVLDVADHTPEDIDQLATGLKRSLRLKSGNRPISLAEPDTEEDDEEENEGEENDEAENAKEEEGGMETMDVEEGVEETEGSEETANGEEVLTQTSCIHSKNDINAASTETLDPESGSAGSEAPEILNLEERAETDSKNLCESTAGAQSTCNLRQSEGDTLEVTDEAAITQVDPATGNQTDDDMEEESEVDEDEVELDSADEEVEDTMGGESEVDEDSDCDAQDALDIDDAEDSVAGFTTAETPCSGMEALLLACGQVRWFFLSLSIFHSRFGLLSEWQFGPS